MCIPGCTLRGRATETALAMSPLRSLFRLIHVNAKTLPLNYNDALNCGNKLCYPLKKKSYFRLTYKHQYVPAGTHSCTVCTSTLYSTEGYRMG
jgi:hypothetical protein